VLPYVWYLHRPVVLLVDADANRCMMTLKAAAQPSTQRLHLRSVFANGRRYQLQPRQDGFYLTTTRKVSWHYRRRTGSVVRMFGSFSSFGDQITRLELRSRIHMTYLLDTFFIPFIAAAIIWYVPWPPLVTAMLILVLLGLSWVGHRSHAALEAHEMIWFVQKALEELIVDEIKGLSPSTPDLTYDPDFEAEWRKFYEEQQDRSQP
jgi:hypothetical protein